MDRTGGRARRRIVKAKGRGGFFAASLLSALLGPDVHNLARLDRSENTQHFRHLWP